VNLWWNDKDNVQAAAEFFRGLLQGLRANEGG
jgi:hypothetical protein